MMNYLLAITSALIGLFFPLINLNEYAIKLKVPLKRFLASIFAIFTAFFIVFSMHYYKDMGYLWISLVIFYIFTEFAFSFGQSIFIASLIFFMSFFGVYPINFLLLLFFILALILDYEFFQKLIYLIKKYRLPLKIQLVLKRHLKLVVWLSNINSIFLIILGIMAISFDPTEFYAFIIFKVFQLISLSIIKKNVVEPRIL